MRSGSALGAAMALLVGLAGASASWARPTAGPVALEAPHRPPFGGVARSFRIPSPSGNTVTGEVIAGQGRGPHPGILFVHWLGDPATTNRTEFEAEAAALARKGFTSVLVDAMWSTPGWFRTTGKSVEDDTRVSEAQITDLRAALDHLVAQPGVDPARIGYVGHDFGAMFGALMAARDQRPRVYVLMAGAPTLSQWYLFGKTAPSADYAARIDRLDIQGSIGKSTAKGFLFQFSAHDHYISAQDEATVAAAAPLPRGAFYYDVDHSLATPQARRDRDAWLIEQLGGD